MAAIELSVAILRRVEHQVAERVGTVVGEVEEEWSLLVLLDELYPIARPQVRRVARLFAHLAIFDDFLIVELARAAVGLRHPKAEALRQMKVVAEVPLAAESAD